MKKSVALCVALALALAGVVGLAGAAKAQDNPAQYGVFRVHNNTDQAITYRVNWNNLGWVNWTVQAGATNSHWMQWNPGQPFPGARWTYHDYTKGVWSPVGPPAAAIGAFDPSKPLNGGFSNNFVLVNDGKDLYVGSSD